MSLTMEEILQAQMLHDRATRGEQLLESEQSLLAVWHAELNRQEAQALFGGAEVTTVDFSDQKKIASLQEQIDCLLQELATTTARLQETSAQNSSLRNEIAALRRQVGQQLALEPA